MKKVLFALPLLAAALWSCSSDEPTPSVNPSEVSNGEPKYMAITLTSDYSRSRAEQTNPDYEDGLDFENKVNTVDFYFFDEQGNAAPVKYDNSNHLTVSDFTETGKEDFNITNGTKAVIVIQTPKDRAIPTQIVAVVNKEAGEVYAGLSIRQLQDKLTEGRTGNSFVMTNSVYVSGGAEQIGAQVAGHLFSDEDEAKANPVTIYVERTLAKVRLKSSITEVTLTDGTKAYNPNKADKEEKFGDKQIYVKFLGWNTTATSENDRLIKKINPLWNAGWTWYDAYLHRSFWAINANDNTYNYFMFEGDANSAKGITDFNGAYTYIKENAAASDKANNPATPSQVIIAAQLVDEDGKPVEMAEWAGQRMTVDDLKLAFANAATLYYKTEGVDEAGQTITIFNKIDPSEIEIKTATDAGYLNDNDNKRYLVYGVLTADAAKKVWYSQPLNDAVLNPALTAEQIKEIFFAMGGAKVWTEGKTYFYFDIRHIPYDIETAEFGKLGVVRNHVYDAGVTSLVGLGTPVYKPEEVIIPEKPSDDETFIAAQIKVLSWRLVTMNIPLEW